jgi:hypothetical protein
LCRVRIERDGIAKLCVSLLLGGIAIATVLVVTVLKKLHSEVDANACAGRLKQLGVALGSYYELYNRFPPATICDSHGKAMHSWRVLILPFCDMEELFERYDFKEPWDGPSNINLLESRAARMFQCPGLTEIESACTNYVVIVGPHTMWPGVTGGKIGSGDQGKLLLIETSYCGIKWMEPRDFSEQEILSNPTKDGLCISTPHVNGLQYLAADGRVGILPKGLGRPALEALIMREGPTDNNVGREDILQRLLRLRHCLKGSPFFRREGARLLGEMGGAAGPAVEDLRQLLNDKDVRVRVAAKEAVSRITGSRSGKKPQTRVTRDADEDKK